MGHLEIDRLGKNERFWMAKYETLMRQKQDLHDAKTKLYNELKEAQIDSENLKIDKRALLE